MSNDQVKGVSGEWPPQGGRSGLGRSLLHVARQVLTPGNAVLLGVRRSSP